MGSRLWSRRSRVRAPSLTPRKRPANTRLCVVARVDRPGKVQAVAPVLKLCRPAGLGDKSERLDVAWAHDAEMPLIERRDHLQVAALGERDHRGVNHPQRQVDLLDQL